MVKIEFKNLDQIAALYNYLESSLFESGNVYLDNLINSIIETITIKLFNKHKNQSIRAMKLKKFEALALITFYTEVQVKTDPYQAAALFNIFNPLHQKIA